MVHRLAEQPQPASGTKVDFLSYAGANFQQQQKRGFFKTRMVPVTQTVKFTNKPLERPLLPHASKEAETAALDAFTHVLAWLFGRDDPTSRFKHARALLKRGMKMPGLRDEIYCQLCKQCTATPTHALLVRAWQLMSIACSVLPPTPVFVGVLQTFLMTSQECMADKPAMRDVLSVVKFSYRALCSTLHNAENGLVRTMPPSSIELDSIVSREPFVCRICFADGGKKAFFVDSSTTVGELFDAAARAYLLDDPTCFAIVESYADYSEQKLPAASFVGDALSRYEMVMKGVSAEVDFQLSFRRRLCLHPKMVIVDPVELLLTYYELQRCVLSSRLEVSLQDAIRLGTMQLYIAQGMADADFEPRDFVPVKLFQEKYASQWCEWLFKCKHDLFSDAEEAADVVMSAYIKYLQRSPLFGFEVFNAKKGKDCPASIPDRLQICVYSLGIVFLTPNQELIESFRYFHFDSWRAEEGVLVITRAGESAPLHLKLRQAHQVADLMTDYLETMSSVCRFARARESIVVGDIFVVKDGVVEVDRVITTPQVSQWHIVCRPLARPDSEWLCGLCAWFDFWPYFLEFASESGIEVPMLLSSGARGTAHVRGTSAITSPRFLNRQL